MPEGIPGEQLFAPLLAINLMECCTVRLNQLAGDL